MKKFIDKKTLADLSTDFSTRGMMLPQDAEQEKSLLGNLISFPINLLNVIDLLKPTDFYYEKHQIIYKAIIDIHYEGNTVTALNVIKKIRKGGELEFCGGSQYIASLPTKFIEEKKEALYLIEIAKKRELISLCELIKQDAYLDTSDVFFLIDKLQDGISELLSIKAQKNTDFSYIAEKTIKEIKEKDNTTLPGLPSKFKKINELTGGYRKGTLRTIAARPGIGKSLHLVNEAQHISKLGYNVAIFSLEMPDKEIMKRTMSIGTQIEGYKLDRNQLSNDEMTALEKFVEISSGVSIDIDDSAGINIGYLINQIKRIILKNEIKNPNKQGLDIVFIDYLQIMELDNENRNIGLGNITRRLKTLSKEYNICIVVYSQLNREVEKRVDREPRLSDLKESGSIEDDSDVVEFLQRPEKYGIEVDSNNESTIGMIYITVAKNRQGGLDETKLRFLPTISTIMEASTNSFSSSENINTFESEPKRTSEINF